MIVRKEEAMHNLLQIVRKKEAMHNLLQFNTWDLERRKGSNEPCK